jgi:uncharacterized Zn-finger protein
MTSSPQKTAPVVKLSPQDLTHGGQAWCPHPKAGIQTWNGHPRVFLNLADGQARCPYCGIGYRLEAVQAEPSA